MSFLFIPDDLTLQAIAVMLADAGKGAGAVMLAGGGVHAATAGAAAVIGHIYPIWLKFKLPDVNWTPFKC